MSPKFNLIFGSGAVQRLARGIAAQGYGHAVTIGLQLASVPILLSTWGEARYGSWLLLSVLTTYLTLSELGFAQAATNDMTVSMSRGQSDQARRTFHSLLMLCLGISGLVIGIGGMLAGLSDLTQLLNLRGISELEAKVVTMILAVQTAFAILGGGLSGALRAEGRFATMSTLNNSARLAEGLACLGTALAGGGVIGAAVAMFVARGVSIGLLFGLLLRGSPVFRPGFREARLEELRRLAGPSLAFMAFPLGNALMIQGALTLIGIRFPAAVVLFATSRTLARLGATVLGSVNHAFLFDYGRTLGTGDRLGFLRLFRLNGMLILGGLIAYAFAMLTVGPAFYVHWTAGEVTLDLTLLVLLIALSASETLWACLQTPLIAVNAHAWVAIAYLAGAAVTLGIGAISLGHGLGLEGFIGIQAAIHLLLSVAIGIELNRRLPRMGPRSEVRSVS